MEQIPGWLMAAVLAAGMTTAYAEGFDQVAAKAAPLPTKAPSAETS